MTGEDESYELAYFNAWSSSDASASVSNEKSVRHRRVMTAIQAKGAPEGLQTAWSECKEVGFFEFSLKFTKTFSPNSAPAPSHMHTAWY